MLEVRYLDCSNSLEGWTRQHQQFQQTTGPQDPEEIMHIKDLQNKFEKIREGIDSTPSDLNSFKQ